MTLPSILRRPVLASPSLLALPLPALALAACTPSRTYVLDAPPMVGQQPAINHRAVAIREAQSAEPAQEVPAELREHFRGELVEALADDKPALPVVDQADLTIAYRFILLTRGNTPVRIGSGLLNLLGSPFYGLGDGAVGVEVAFLGPTGQPLGRIVSDGPIAGIFGNSKDAAKTAAQSVAKYVKVNYTTLVPPAKRSSDE